MCRDFVRRLCLEIPGCQVVGEATTLSEALDIIRWEAPDLVLIDLNLADWQYGRGFDVAEIAGREFPLMHRVFMSVHCHGLVARRIAEARAFGFIDKTFNAVDLFRQALREVVAGRPYFSPCYYKALERLRLDPQGETRLLTNRELEVLSLVGHALSDAEIAARLDLSVSTVEKCRQHIMQKLDLPSSLKLMKFAIDRGYTQFGGFDLPAPNCLA